LCRAVPGPATAFLWTASRRSYGKRGNRLGPAGLCQRSIYSSWQIAKRRIRTSASVTPRHRKRLSHLRSRARSQGLRKCRRRSSVTRRHRKQSSHPRAHPTQSRLPRKRRQPRRAIRLASAKSDLVPVFEKKMTHVGGSATSLVMITRGSESCLRGRASSPYLNDLLFSWVGRRVRLVRDETQAGRLARPLEGPLARRLQGPRARRLQGPRARRLQGPRARRRRLSHWAGILLRGPGANLSHILLL